MDLEERQEGESPSCVEFTLRCSSVIAHASCAHLTAEGPGVSAGGTRRERSPVANVK